MNTIVDVAREANVSVSTASRILNGAHKGMRRDAVERARTVLAAAKKLGYQPNSAARSLVLKRSFTIGFVATEIHNPVRTKLIDTLRALAQKRGFGILTVGVEWGEDPGIQLENLLNHQVDGLILTHLAEYSEACLTRLRKQGIPFVGFGEPGPTGFDNVTIDYAQMAYDMTTHLLKRHHVEQIVYAGNSCSRYDGYRRALLEEGFSNPLHWRADTVTLESGRALVKEFVTPHTLPQAIVCHNDLLALGIIAGLRDLGYSVPKHVLVTGIDNIEFATFSNPTLSTAGVNGGALAELLCEHLFRQMAPETTPKPVMPEMPVEYFFRESCGCRKPDNI